MREETGGPRDARWRMEDFLVLIVAVCHSSLSVHTDCNAHVHGYMRIIMRPTHSLRKTTDAYQPVDFES